LPTKSLSRLDRGADAVRPPIGEIDQRRGAAPQRRLSDVVRPLGGERRAVRQDPRVMHVDVRIDAAWDHDLAGRIDDARSRGVAKRPRRRDRRDSLAFDRDVATRDALRRHHVAAANDQVEHGAILPYVRPIVSVLQPITSAYRPRSPGLS
jgi:hypothetical protein